MLTGLRYRLALTPAQENYAEETIAALTAERDNALAALRRRSAQRDQLDARCEELVGQREELTARAERAEAAIAAVRTLPESPDGNVVIPAAAEEWQNGWRWGWRYAIQAAKRALCVDPCGYPNCWHPENGCARFAALVSTDPPEPEAEIWVDRGRFSGDPCVYGSRLPVETLVSYADQLGDEAALEAYPSATAESLAAARWFLTQWQRVDSTDPPPPAQRPEERSEEEKP